MVSSMNRLSLLIFFSLAGLCLEAQTFSTITISTVPNGARFMVDGQQYNSAATLSWPVGSTHILMFVTDPLQAGNGNACNPGSNVQTSLDGSTAYTFAGWTDNANLLQANQCSVQTITANPAITTLTATLTVAYRVMLNFFNPGPQGIAGAAPVCGAPGNIALNQFQPGLIEINGVCYWSSVNLFLPANGKVVLNAFPYPGYVFLGWAMNSGPTNPYLTSLTLNGPITLAPQFSPGKRVHFLTSPLGLNVSVDHTSVPTRTDGSNLSGPCPSNQSQSVSPGLGIPPVCFGDFDFAPGSTHVISGVSPQLDNAGKWWVFTQWSNGAGPNAVYTTDNNTATPDTLTATFVPGAHVSFVTNPPGLTLNVDGRQNWPSYNFIWGLGSTHQISAAATQFDARSRQYTFQGWSNSAAASQTVNIDQTAVNNGLRMIATYSVLSRVVVQSSPSGQTVQVDGTSCQTPCNVDRKSGANVHVTAQTQIPMGTGSRLDFNAWSDGGASDHLITVNQDYTILTANYTTSYQLSASSTPANGVSFQFSPTSSDMYYAQNTQVSITATPNPGFKFFRWNGALAGSYPSGVVTMSSPQSVIAQMNTVPYIAPAGVMNAAGTTPTAAVAPGSIISIFGQGLSPKVQVGPVNPLAQTVSGTTVTVNSEILPLQFVSQQQINAQLPSDLSDGTYTLLVHNSGQPDVSGNLTVARNAPGLFFQFVNSQQYVVALHADGSAVTPNSPATAGEKISILGTGFGPYNGNVVDGFFPPTPPPSVTDSVTLTVAGQNPAVNWSGAASGFTGIVSTSFTVPNGLPSGAPAPLKVTVNGVDSNTVMLPVQ
jgi:uncharacterized protein (TIGR03437 family)